MKTLWAIILIFVLTDNLTGQNTRKNTFPIRITVCDSINHEPLFLATISLTQDNHKIIAGSSDAQGEYLFPSVQTGVYKLKVSFIGYKTYTDTIRITGDFSLHILLAPDQVVMQEVIVTARESHGMTSSSIIDRKAMEHLQPSSFSDLLELLPGGRSADPALNQVTRFGCGKPAKVLRVPTTMSLPAVSLFSSTVHRSIPEPICCTSAVKQVQTTGKEVP